MNLFRASVLTSWGAGKVGRYSDWKHIIPISASVIIQQFFPSVSVSVRKFPSYRDTSHGVRPLPSPA